MQLAVLQAHFELVDLPDAMKEEQGKSLLAMLLAEYGAKSMSVDS